MYGKQMAQHGYGAILNLASVAAFFPGPGMATYYATKAYVLSLGEALSYELQGTGVTVTTLCPGPTATHFAQAAKVQGKLFKGKLPTATEVAAYGYSAMKRGKRIAIYGMGNKFGVYMTRFLPRRLVTAMVARIQSR